MLFSGTDSLTQNEQNIVEWVRYTDAIGPIAFDEFMKLPAQFITTVFMIRAAENLKQLIEQKRDAKDRDQRKKLDTYIREIEAIFGNESERN